MAKTKKKTELDMPIPSNIMDDLCSRFVINSGELQYHPIRVFYMMEKAHFHYVDLLWQRQPDKLPRCDTFKTFSKHNFEDYYQLFLDQKCRNPVFGGILLTPCYTHVLLVQSYGNTWGFPKGKQEVGETTEECAIREVYEETSIDIEAKLVKDRYIEETFSEQLARFYIITDVPMESKCSPRLRMEIKDYRFFPVGALPVYKNDPNTKLKTGVDARHFFRIPYFVRMLQQWIADHSKQHMVENVKARPASEFTTQGRNRKREAKKKVVYVEHRVQDSCVEIGDDKDEQGHVTVNTTSGTPLSTGEDTSRPGYDSSIEPALAYSTMYEPNQSSVLCLDEFHSKALLNFKFDISQILNCLISPQK